MKILLGGSPCTYWSIAQKNNRETEPSGLGWELFENYLIAKEKFKPDFFLYENNKSAAQAIKDEIKKRFNVWDGTLLTPDSGARYIEINSALVSAQNRQRFYVHNCGEVEQPKDRGILLKDILESGIVEKDKWYCLKHQAGNARDYFKKHHTNIKFELVAEPVCVAQRGRYSDSGNRSKKGDGDIEQYYEAREGGKTNALTTVQKDNMVAEPVNITKEGKAKALRASADKDGIRNFITNEYDKRTCVAEPVIFQLPHGYNDGGCKYEKSPTLTANASWQDNNKVIELAKNKNKLIYEVRNGKITIKDKQYPIKLADGFYIIRKLTVTECCRLQTMPDDYCRAVSASQAYKGLGNGWTAEVIIHILNSALKDVPRDEEIVVLSMYDGIGTGRYCLDKMGFTNVKYYAYEIDKYAIQIAKSNYPDIIECGDAFQVRNKDWKL